MSSILDALKKLEKNSPTPISKTTPKSDLPKTNRVVALPPPVKERERTTTSRVPMAIIIGAVLIGLFHIIASLGSSFLMSRSNVGVPNVAPKTFQNSPGSQVRPDTTPPVPSPNVRVQPPVESATPPPESLSNLPAYPRTQPPNTVVNPKTKPVAEIPVLPSLPTQKSVAPVSPTPPVYPLKSIPVPNPSRVSPPPVVQQKNEEVPANETAIEQPVTPTERQGAVIVEPLKKPEPVESSVDFSVLPGLSEADRVRWGLTGMQVNMLLPANKNRPIASAIINMKTVRVGERIPNTKATLIAVDLRNIAIKIEETGQRFRVRF